MIEPARWLNDLAKAPELGGWFRALTAVMSGGNPPIVRFAADQAIMRAGDKADRFLVILEGSAAVSDLLTVDTELEVGPGALLGELGVLFEGRRRRTVVARTPVVAVAGTREELEQGLQVEAVGSHVASVAARRLAERVEPIPATTAKGLAVILRPLLPTDRQIYHDALGKLSLGSLKKRFFVARRPPDTVLERLIHIDYIDHVAWVAIDSEGRALGICRLIVQADDPGVAEIALGVLKEDVQGQGLGTLLVGTVGVLAQSRGQGVIIAHTLSDNLPMRAVFDKAGASWMWSEPGVVKARMDTADVAALVDGETAARVTQATAQLGRVAQLADA